MQCLQYNVKFTLKAIRNSKSNIVIGRTNQQSKGGEVHLENNLRMSRSRMNLIRENSRHEILEPICTRDPSNKRRRRKKTKPANNARLKRDCSSASNVQSEVAGAVKEQGQRGEDQIHWTIIMATLFFLALSRLVFLFAKLL